MRAPHDSSRRQFLKKTAYVAPLILTLKVAPALAHSGSCDNKTTSWDTNKTWDTDKTWDDDEFYR